MNFLPENPNFADMLDADIIGNSQPMSLPCSPNTDCADALEEVDRSKNPGNSRPKKYTGQQGEFRSIEEIDPKYRGIFTYQYFNLVQSRVIEDALYSDKSMVICAPTGSGKTVVFEMAIAQLLMDIEDKNYEGDFKIIYMAPVKALCTERLTEWYPKLTKLGLLCIEVTGDTDVEFPMLKPYKVIITTPEKWDMLTRRWRDYRGLVEVVKLFLIDEVHILNDNVRGPVLEAVVSRMKTIESSVQSAHRIEQLQRQYRGNNSKDVATPSPRIRFVAVSATVSNPQDVAAWLGAADKPAVYNKFGDECRPVKIMRVVEGYPCQQGTSIFKFDIILNYKLWPIIQKYHNGKPTLIFCNTRKSVALTADVLSREITINFNPEQKAKLMALASTIKNKKLQALILNGVGCHHAGLLFEERMNIEHAFRNRDLPILITTTTLAMGVNLPAHLVIIKNTQQYVNGAYQEYSISTILQMVGRAGRPQFDTEATAVIMTRMADKARYQALVEGTEPLQSFLHKRLAENLNSEAALGTVTDVAQCVQWVNSTFLSVRAAKDPWRYLGLPHAAPANQISKKIEELCVIAMNGLASSGLITMDENSCIESTEAGKLMSVYYIDLETMKLIMKIDGSETLDRLLWLICESHELADMHLRVDERRCLNTLNRNNNAATIRFPMKGKITSRQMKLNCVIQAVLGCLPIADPSLNQEAMKIMRIALRVCKCLVAYTTRPASESQQPKTFSAVFNSIVLTKCLSANLWENSPYVSKQLKGIGPAFSMLLASAGKTNFLLLEESHPRDLERIMNKGPPAGNVIRKQISLLPKYQLTTLPIDRDRVNIQLMLLNQAYLAENLENVTAGINHKSYIVVGDSENNLLYLTSFKDTDLINIYDGRITCEVTRKHSHEHKITAHCVSSTFVGIDVQTEFSFIEIHPNYNKTIDSNINIICKDDSRETNIAEQRTADRKRKVTKNIDVACSKEKIKRDNTLIRNFKNLKESFGKTTKEIMGNIRKSTHMSEEILENLTNQRCDTNNTTFETIPVKDVSTKDNVIITLDDDYFNKDEEFEHLEDEDQVNNIISKIENEMGKTITEPLQVQEHQRDLLFSNWNKRDTAVYNINETRRKNKKQVKCNFNVIDLLNKDISDDESDVIVINDNAEGFTNNVKSKIDQYLQNVQSSKSSYKDIINLVQIEDDVINIENDESSLCKMMADEILINCSEVQHDNSIVQSKSHTVVHSPILIQNIEEDSNNKYLENLTNNEDSLDDNYNNCKNPTEYNEMDRSNHENILVVSPKDESDTNRQLSSSSLVTIDNRNEIQENQNYNNLKMKTDIPLEYIIANVDAVNNDTVKYNLSQIKTFHERACDQNIFCNNNSEAQNLSDSNFIQEVNHQCYTTLHGSAKIPPELDNNISPPEMNGTKDNALQPYLDYKDELQKSNEYQAIDIHKSCIKSPTENQIDFQHYSMAQNSNFKNTDLFDTTNNLNADSQLNKPEENIAHIEKYCFHTTQFNVCSKNDNIHTVKIISKLKIDLDITKIVSTKQERTNSNEPAFSDFENKNSNYTKTIEPEFNDSKIAVQSKTNQENIINNISNNMQLKEDAQETTEVLQSYPEMDTEETKDQTTKATVLQSCPEMKKPVLNEFNANSGNKVEDILKKYSNIMSSRKSNIVVVPVTKTINDDIITKPSANKPKRRYRISDLINSNTKETNKIIDDFNLINFSNIVINRDQHGAIHNDYLNGDIRSSDKCIESSDRNLHKATPLRTDFTNETNDDCEINIEIVGPNSKTFELPRNFSLNNTMLNPKTLLECYNNDNTEEVIPPPAEFSDDTNLAIHINATAAYSPLSPDYDPDNNCPYDVLNKSSNYETKDLGNIFNDVSQDDGELSPSEEIDTWKLSPEDQQNDTLMPFVIQNPNNNCKVTQNVPGISTLLSYKRNVKLGEFKYKRKNTFKIRK